MVPIPDVVPSDILATDRVRRWAAATLGLLLAQNLLGIYVNLFVRLPPDPSGDQLVTSNLALTIHVGAAFGLIGLAAWVTFQGYRTRSRALLGTSAFGLASLVLAALAGFAFVFRGQDDASSFLMELFFALSVAAEVAVVYLAGRPGSVQRSAEHVSVSGGAKF